MSLMLSPIGASNCPKEAASNFPVSAFWFSFVSEFMLKNGLSTESKTSINNKSNDSKLVLKKKYLVLKYKVKEMRSNL